MRSENYKNNFIGLLMWFFILWNFLTAGVCNGFAASKVQKKGTSSSSSGTGFGTNNKQPTSYDPISTDNDMNIQQLVQTIVQNKATVIDGTEIGYDKITGRRGLYATKNFNKDKIICKIPSDFALALSDPAKKGQDAPTMVHAGANFLSMYKNNDKQKSIWSFYLNTLPDETTVDTTPDFFTDDEIDLLEFPKIIKLAKERKQQIQQLSKEIGINEYELQVATALVSSRVFTIAIAEEDKTVGLEEGDIALDDRGQVISKGGERNSIRVLVPYIDMANHKSDGNYNAKITLIDPDKDDAWFALQATRNIKAGKEITISYGSQVDSSVELFMNYGFVPDNNPIDKIMLKKKATDDIISSLDEWTTTLEEDEKMLQMIENDIDESNNLQKILQFRIQLKRSY